MAALVAISSKRRVEGPDKATAANAGNNYFIAGIPVSFPKGKVPFTAQRGVMYKVLRALKKSENALIESPTGTGKTLALLCSTLGWQRFHMLPNDKAVKKQAEAGERQKISKHKRIFFTSRTHTQIAQVIDELKKCPTHEDIKISVLASRKRYCINKTVLASGNVDDECKSLTERQGCQYSKRAAGLIKQLPKIWDIEDIVQEGDAHKGCPYYAARQSTVGAHIIFCPYNYIFDPLIKKAMDINLNNSIIVVDEAHNIASVLEDAASCEVTDDDLAHAEKQFGTLKLRTKSKASKGYACFEHIMKNLRDFLEFCSASSHTSNEPLIQNGTELASLLSARCAVDEENIAQLTDSLEAINSSLVDSIKSGKLVPSKRALSIAERLVAVFSFFLRDGMRDMEHFRLVVKKERKFVKSSFKGMKGQFVWESKLCIWCLSAAVAFQDVHQKAHSVILASGTLSPLTSFAAELGASFKQSCSTDHVINARKQLWVGAVGRVSSNRTTQGSISLKATYTNVNTLDYQDALGFVVERFLRVIPQGVLLFVPSYSFLEKVVNRWKNTGALRRMASSKKIFLEPRSGGPEVLDMCLSKYIKACTDGALLLSVFRGKVSEGIDFSDHYARAVIIVGIPYPSYKDVKVKLKKDHLDAISSDSNGSKKTLTGATWYRQCAYRAINQALGRCIRHKADYGAILLLDSRFSSSDFRVDNLSSWVRPNVLKFGSDIQASARSLGAFFEDQKVQKENVRDSSGEKELKTQQNIASLPTSCDSLQPNRIERVASRQKEKHAAGRQTGEREAVETMAKKKRKKKAAVRKCREKKSRDWGSDDDDFE